MTKIRDWHRTSEASRRLATISGVGVITATALAATITDPSYFRSGRALVRMVGSDTAIELVRRQTSIGADQQGW